MGEGGGEGNKRILLRFCYYRLELTIVNFKKAALNFSEADGNLFPFLFGRLQQKTMLHQKKILSKYRMHFNNDLIFSFYLN